MKTIYGATALAALAGLATAKDQQTFSVLRFNGMVTQGRMDPIVSPGEDSQHVHGVLGGIGFHKSATKDDLMNSECTSAKVQGDNSAYWFPTLYFKDPNNDEVESVNMYYANVYYLYAPSCPLSASLFEILYSPFFFLASMPLTTRSRPSRPA